MATGPRRAHPRFRFGRHDLSGCDGRGRAKRVLGFSGQHLGR